MFVHVSRSARTVLPHFESREMVLFTFFECSHNRYHFQTLPAKNVLFACEQETPISHIFHCFRNVPSSSVERKGSALDISSAQAT